MVLGAQGGPVCASLLPATGQGQGQGQGQGRGCACVRGVNTEEINAWHWPIV